MHSFVKRLLFVFMSFCCGGPAFAYCVYNKIDKDIHFYGADGKTFHEHSSTIDPGESSCCHYSNGDCNPSKSRTKTLESEVYVLTGKRWPSDPTLDCGEKEQGDGTGYVKHQAGGYLTVNKNSKYVDDGWSSPDNPKYYVYSYSYDHKLLRKYTCPARWVSCSGWNCVPIN